MQKKLLIVITFCTFSFVSLGQYPGWTIISGGCGISHCLLDNCKDEYENTNRFSPSLSLGSFFEYKERNSFGFNSYYNNINKYNRTKVRLGVLSLCFTQKFDDFEF